MNDDDFDPDEDYILDDDELEDLEDDDTPTLKFPDVYSFVSDFLRHCYPVAEHRLSELNWSKNWWQYPHAVLRLEGLWRRFEQLRRDEPETYIETFLRSHADYHMAQLMADGGMLSDAKRRDIQPLPLPHHPPTTESS